jgi:hypothetical protein
MAEGVKNPEKNACFWCFGPPVGGRDLSNNAENDGQGESMTRAREKSGRDSSRHTEGACYFACPGSNNCKANKNAKKYKALAASDTVLRSPLFSFCSSNYN